LKREIESLKSEAANEVENVLSELRDKLSEADNFLSDIRSAAASAASSGGGFSF
jgi:hypothetical protein